jgi:hypothetical protein
MLLMLLLAAYRTMITRDTRSARFGMLVSYFCWHYALLSTLGRDLCTPAQRLAWTWFIITDSVVFCFLGVLGEFKKPEVTSDAKESATDQQNGRASS